jgi:hypothetical protein
MKQLYLILFVFTILISCNREKLPEGILGKNKMIPILIDIHLSESITNQRFALGLTQDSLPENLYLSICKKHNVDRKTLENSLYYYGRNPEKFTGIYNAVVDQLNEMEIEAKKDTLPDIVPAMSGDTIKKDNQVIPGDSAKSQTAADTIKSAMEPQKRAEKVIE